MKETELGEIIIGLEKSKSKIARRASIIEKFGLNHYCHLSNKQTQEK